MAWWQANVLASGSFAGQGLTDFRTTYMNCRKGAEVPNLIVSTPSVYNFIENTLQPQERFPQTDAWDPGPEAIRFRKATVVPDDDCNSGVAYMLNLNFLKLKVHRKANFKLSIPREAWDQDVVAAKLLFQSALTTANRRTHGKNTGIVA